jgi:thiamine-phosphate pyrophosphorylase
LTLPDPPILVITDRRMASQPLADVVEAALRGGCRWILLREPDLATDGLIDLGRTLQPLCRRHGSILSVSADGAAAAALGAGLQLPQRAARPGCIASARAALGAAVPIGISCHSREEADAAARLGADYITLSPVFLTDSKPGYGPALGTDRLSSLVAAVGVPVLGLGGITAENAAAVRRSGAAGIAVMGLIMRAPDAAAAFAALRTAWRG